MKVVLTQAALADLRDIGHWIALDDPDRPLLYPLASEAGKGVRKRRHGRYLILYLVARDRIEILHVVHGARNYRELFTRL